MSRNANTTLGCTADQQTQVKMLAMALGITSHAAVTIILEIFFEKLDMSASIKAQKDLLDKVAKLKLQPTVISQS